MVPVIVLIVLLRLTMCLRSPLLTVSTPLCLFRTTPSIGTFAVVVIILVTLPLAIPPCSSPILSPLLARLPRLVKLDLRTWCLNRGTALHRSPSTALQLFLWSVPLQVTCVPLSLLPSRRSFPISVPLVR